MNSFEIIKKVFNKKFLRSEQVPFEMLEDKPLKGKPVHKITISSIASASVRIVLDEAADVLFELAAAMPEPAT